MTDREAHHGAMPDRRRNLCWTDAPWRPVSLLLDLGVPPHIIRDIVGHSDTMTIYVHAPRDEERKARKLGDVLG